MEYFYNLFFCFTVFNHKNKTAHRTLLTFERYFCYFAENCHGNAATGRSWDAEC